MKNLCFIVVLVGVVWHSFTLGFPHGGYKSPVKRSDYSMYDNQFFSVGDTPLDNEVTDCAVVRHQYARGYIRLREYLERMQGCGTAGKRKNIAGIAAATQDATTLTSDGFRIPTNNVVHVAPFKPRPIGQLIDNIGNKQAQVKAYNGQVKNLQEEMPFQRHAIQRSRQNRPSFNNLDFLSRTNGALSYKKNSAAQSTVLPVARKFISRKNLNTNPLQAFKTLNDAKHRKQYYMSPDPQRYYSMQTAETKHAYKGPIAVGQPLLRPSPLAFNHQASTGSKIRIPQADQPVNPDLNMDKAQRQKQQMNAQAGNRHDAVPVKPDWQVGDERVQDDLEGQDGVKDEATEIGSLKSDPIPSDAAFTENPKLDGEDQESEQKMDNSKEAEQPQEKMKNDVSSNQPQKPTIDDLEPAEKNKNIDSSSHSIGVHNDAEDNAKETNEQSESNKLDEFLKPNTYTNDERKGENGAQSSNEKQETNAFSKEEEKASNSDGNHSDDKGGIAINLDVLKDKISSSKDIGFLKRMLTLIKKITHHKDFNKLAGAQKNAIVQAGKAVNSVVRKGSNTERSFIQPRPANTSPNTGYNRGGTQYVNSYISEHPPRWKVGDRTLTGSAKAQFYSGRQHEISKKFQIERNPYYQQQPRVSYTPPYFSLQRLNYGIYNGNVP
ncbi:uncharacterized protein LOC116307178 [Actinia tenebrosa]|uniref:Uncharacterized protein LOC116307178 n=1 Tax=Actinia tenebrosa TaxID=6105 RepID=A0A6P8J054_ACTTE|nr:uncharacterized protein LOC116307178 [Actinia tenebrosa]